MTTYTVTVMNIDGGRMFTETTEDRARAKTILNEYIRMYDTAYVHISRHDDGEFVNQKFYEGVNYQLFIDSV